MFNILVRIVAFPWRNGTEEEGRRSIKRFDVDNFFTTSGLRRMWIWVESIRCGTVDKQVDVPLTV